MNIGDLELADQATATVYAHAMLGDVLAAAAWEKFQNAGRPSKPRVAKPVKPGRARRSA